METNTMCGARNEDRTGCCGSCWLNVAGMFDVWKIISNKCGGKKKNK